MRSLFSIFPNHLSSTMTIHPSARNSNTASWDIPQPTHSVNMHARSVLPIVYIGTLRACQQISADASQSVWADSRSDRIGPPHVQSVWASLTFKACGLSATFQAHGPMGLHISVWAGTPLQAAWPVHIYIWMFGSNGQK